MDNLNFGIFVVPTVALTLAVLLYNHFSKKTTDRLSYRHFIFTIVITAFTLNLIWEVAQGPLYESYQYDWKHISMCALASVADAIWVLLIYFGFSIVYKDIYCVQHFTVARICVVMLSGSIGAIISEIGHTSMGNWMHDESMPLVPILEVGVSPVLQFMLLPTLIYLLSFYGLKFYHVIHTS